MQFETKKYKRNIVEEEAPAGKNPDGTLIIYIRDIQRKRRDRNKREDRTMRDDVSVREMEAWMCCRVSN